MSLDESDHPSYGVPPVERAFKVLRAIASGDEMRNIAQSARRVGISRTTLIRLLATLEAERMVERTRDGSGFRLGVGLAGLAAQALSSSDIVQSADPILASLTETLGLSSHLGILEGRDVLYVARRTPNLHLISNVRIGSRLPAHATTMGRIILAYLPKDDVARIFAGARLKAVTPKTHTTLSALQKQLEQDRHAGIAWSSSHFEPGISSAAAPVFDHTSRIVAAINVTGPSGSFDVDKPRLASIELAIRAATAELSRRLGHVGAEAVPKMRRAK